MEIEGGLEGDGRQKSEVGRRKSEDGSRETEVGSRKSEEGESWKMASYNCCNGYNSNSYGIYFPFQASTPERFGLIQITIQNDYAAHFDIQFGITFHKAIIL